MAALLPAFDRATLLARLLFPQTQGAIVLTDGDRHWRSRDPGGLPPRDPAADWCMERREPLWIENAPDDPRFADDVTVSGSLGLRFYAAAPIILSDGTVLGVISVVSTEPRARDDSLLTGLAALAGVIADECERARAVAEAQINHAKAQQAAKILTAFIDTVPAPIVMTDRDMRVVAASKRWARFFNSTVQDVVGRSIYDIAPEFMGERRAGHSRALAGERITDRKVRTEFDGKLEFIDNERRPWLDENGEIGGILITSHVVTDMVAAIEELERNQERLEMAMELADLHVWELDYTRKTLEQLGAADTFFDKPFKYEDVAENLTNAIHPDDRDGAAASLARRHAGEAVEPFVCRMARSDGREVWAASATRIIRDESGKVARLMGIFQNVTHMKQAELSLIDARNAAEAANRSKSEFLANMSHEIRTPLNGILGMAQVIEADELTDIQRERVVVVRESGATLLAILNDVLDLSKIQAGKLEFNEAPFDMAELAPVVTAAFDGSAAAKDIVLISEIDESADGVWIGDILRLRQVLSNLVSNALKFTTEGEVRLSVHHDGEALVLDVQDTGIGIDADKISGVFEKFAQEDASTTRRYGGTGLGLSICRELVQAMGGHIVVQSFKGVGSTFSVHLPLKRGAPAPGRAARAKAETQSSSPGAVRILAAEDNTTNQLVLRSLLAPLGVQLTMVGDGRQAVEAYISQAFDLILMDVQMPEMNGVEATLAIRKHESESGRRATPILALTANVMTHQIEDYLAAGMDGAIAKPVEVGKLYAALNQALAATEQKSAAA